MIKYFFFSLIVFVFISCSSSRKSSSILANRPGETIKSSVVLKSASPRITINTGNTDPDDLVEFALTLQGVPYRYGSMDKSKGFDCSGFINYVFRKFNITVPRVSRDFTNAGEEVSTLYSKPGDLILFTGSDPASGVVGHMGIVTKNEKGVLTFIHSASGKGGGVMLSGMNSYFLPRFVKVIRVFK